MNTKRLKQLVENSNLTKVQIAEQCGFTRVTLDKAMQGADVKLSTVESLARAFNVEPGYLISDEDAIPSMPHSENSDGKESMRCILGDTSRRKEEGDSKVNYTTYLLPISSRGGSLTGFSAPGTMLQQCEKIISPIADVDFAISVYGESMSPEYPSGSTVLIKKIDPSIFIDWGHDYVLDTPNGVVLKRLVYNEKNPDTAICRSLNTSPEYADFEIKLSDIYGIYRVLMCLSVK